MFLMDNNNVSPIIFLSYQFYCLLLIRFNNKMINLKFAISVRSFLESMNKAKKEKLEKNKLLCFTSSPKQFTVYKFFSFITILAFLILYLIQNALLFCSYEFFVLSLLLVKNIVTTALAYILYSEKNNAQLTVQRLLFTNHIAVNVLYSQLAVALCFVVQRNKNLDFPSGLVAALTVVLLNSVFFYVEYFLNEDRVSFFGLLYLNVFVMLWVTSSTAIERLQLASKNTLAAVRLEFGWPNTKVFLALLFFTGIMHLFGIFWFLHYKKTPN